MSNDASTPAPVPADEVVKSPAAPEGDAPAVAPVSDAPEPVSKSDGEAKAPAEDGPVPQTNGTPANKKEKRKSIGAASGGKKLNRKQSTLNLNLNVEPGELWLAVMKGYKPWPCIICDEDMLPESLLAKRPVSAQHPDGTYRADFLEGGKNARDRRYPIMFLGSNEFAWHVNTDLRPTSVEQAKQMVEDHKDKPLQPKGLQQAYETAAEGHDLAYFKQLLADHEQWERDEAAALEERAAAKEAEDVEMADADGEAKPKKDKKRKAPKEDVDEEGKPLKTPKKLKINAPQEKDTPVESATKAKPAKAPKKAKAPEKKEEKASASPAPAADDPQKVYDATKQNILYYRHRLQKGFLSRDKPPEESEMPMMHEHLKVLERYPNLDGSIIKATKINKVLKAIVKLATIPRDHEFQFVKRSQDILNSWTPQLAESTAATPKPAANGTTEEEKKDEKPTEDAKPKEASAATSAPATEDPKPKEEAAPEPKEEPKAEEVKTDEPAAPTTEAAPAVAA